MTIAALVLGIISICLSVFSIGVNPFGFSGLGMNPLGILCGIIGIVFGAIAIKRDYMWTGTAKAGFITSIIGTVLGLIVLGVYLVFTYMLKQPLVPYNLI